VVLTAVCTRSTATISKDREALNPDHSLTPGYTFPIKNYSSTKNYKFTAFFSIINSF